MISIFPFKNSYFVIDKRTLSTEEKEKIKEFCISNKVMVIVNTPDLERLKELSGYEPFSPKIKTIQ